MAIRYQISTWNSSTCAEATTCETRAQLGAAQSVLWAQIYAMLAADGALDTERGKRLEKEFDAFQISGHPLPKGKHYFSQNFVMRTDQAGTLEHVKFVAIRDDRC